MEEVRAYKEELMRQSKTLLEHKLQRAEEKRQLQLKLKAQKAHEEEAKVGLYLFTHFSGEDIFLCEMHLDI